LTLRIVPVELGKDRYDILIGAELLGDCGTAIAEVIPPARVAVVTDEHVGPLYGQVVVDSLAAARFEPTLIVRPAGEDQKALETVHELYEAFFEHQMDRRSAVVALGGGVIGDLAGFAAATFLRGIALVQMATSLVAQVDSSVGGKVGVNHPRGKNLIGAFYQPEQVLIEPGVLDTLPGEEFAAGMAEVIKTGIIRDAGLFSFVEERQEAIRSLAPDELTRVLATCCQIKAQVVVEDEREVSGVRAILNFGHTIGHALETVTEYHRYRHGEAVAIGMAGVFRLAKKMKLVKSSLTARVEALLQAYDLPIRADDLPVKAVVAAMAQDKKSIGGRLSWVLPRGIGDVFVSDAVPIKLVRASLREIGLK